MASKRVNNSFQQRKRISNQSRVAAKSNITKTAPVSPALKELAILKNFDLTLEYGPCIGITRMERWERAEKHGLNPAAEVKFIISKHKDDQSYTEWYLNQKGMVTR